MSAGDSTDAAHANTHQWFAAGGNGTSDRPAGELVWNSAAGTFDTVPASQPGQPDPQFVRHSTPPPRRENPTALSLVASVCGVLRDPLPAVPSPRAQAVMTLVADTGMFADAPADQDLVYDSATGTFVAASDTASIAPSTAAPTE
eukprot:CAMPEP_0185704160 /NCGR_PEP_ID=MMETSP1164-20130828/16433_1 /TAXON_ID=1104430 /ORGANISM="Chrysoreinhardia sp, Strain CCMP2950" /LENGTH=144 /DNA_ID=CAMNT_0028371501 /DNA_START=102 /DNA_END=533 /DNA_ORIENTATION=+